LFFPTSTSTSEIYTLSLHDALPIFDLHFRRHKHFGQDQLYRLAVRHDAHVDGRLRRLADELDLGQLFRRCQVAGGLWEKRGKGRSEEHTSELQSRRDLVCRLLLEKK